MLRYTAIDDLNERERERETNMCVNVFVGQSSQKHTDRERGSQDYCLVKGPPGISNYTPIK